MIHNLRVAKRLNKIGFFAKLVINHFYRSDIKSPVILTSREKLLVLFFFLLLFQSCTYCNNRALHSIM